MVKIVFKTLIARMIYIFLKMGQSRPLFVYFRYFLITISITQIEKSIDGVLGNRTWGCSMVGSDKTTGLLRPPKNNIVIVARLDHHGEYRWTNWPRYVGPCLLPAFKPNLSGVVGLNLAYFLLWLQDLCWRPACCWLGWGKKILLTASTIELTMQPAYIGR